MSYGVRGVYAPEKHDDFTGPAKHAASIIKAQRLAEKGDKFIMTAGVPFGTPGSTNMLRIAWVE